MKPTTDVGALTESPRKKPRLALAIATAFGTGYLPKAPGTWGSVVGICLTYFLAILPTTVILYAARARYIGPGFFSPVGGSIFLLFPNLVALLTIAIVGVWAADRVATYSSLSDPQIVVIDEVSGQQLTLMLGLIPVYLPLWAVRNPQFIGYGRFLHFRLQNWTCLLLGLILFRVFDIWKPWPIRRLEKLPGGWGIMADDWMAAIYAAALLWLAGFLEIL